jgi:hypothetical protein
MNFVSISLLILLVACNKVQTEKAQIVGIPSNDVGQTTPPVDSGDPVIDEEEDDDPVIEVIPDLSDKEIQEYVDAIDAEKLSPLDVVQYYLDKKFSYDSLLKILFEVDISDEEFNKLFEMNVLKDEHLAQLMEINGILTKVGKELLEAVKVEKIGFDEVFSALVDKKIAAYEFVILVQAFKNPLNDDELKKVEESKMLSDEQLEILKQQEIKLSDEAQKLLEGIEKGTIGFDHLYKYLHGVITGDEFVYLVSKLPKALTAEQIKLVEKSGLLTKEQIAALKGEEVGLSEMAQEFHEMFLKGQGSFNKAWHYFAKEPKMDAEDFIYIIKDVPGGFNAKYYDVCKGSGLFDSSQLSTLSSYIR